MDIVDTFNHLIPTEHLDDALFLGPNLENEVCEDFSTSQNVLEDSLKNMLSDKDPMLGSASAQFFLPVFDSNDPNFQMPCSTEPVRSLRQSTLAKRSNVAPPANAKKTAVKSGFVQKGGLKQQDKDQSKQEEISAPLKLEHSKDIGCSRRSSQIEETTGVSLPSSTNSKCNSTCHEKMVEVKPDSKPETLSQSEVDETSHELSTSCNLSETRSPTESTSIKTETVMKTEHGTVGPELLASANSETNEEQISAIVKDETRVNQASSETLSKKNSDYKMEAKTESDGSEATEIVNAPPAVTACINPSDVHETVAVLLSHVNERTECSSSNAEAVCKNISSKECKTEHLNDPKQLDENVNLSENSLGSMELDKTDFKSVDTASAKSETNTLEIGFHDSASQSAQQAINIKIEGHGMSKLQDDDKPATISSKCLKKLKPKHIKSMVQSKQSMTAGVPQRLATVKQGIHIKARVGISGFCNPSLVSLKRSAN
uniref:PHD finger protein 3 n=1 Tax=Sphenodon punctatus TaxID=8508 RepID=A0A8D0GNE1_SPHPU